MRIIIFILASIISSGVCAGTWYEIGESDGEALKAHIDLSTVRKVNGKPRAWFMVSYKNKVIENRNLIGSSIQLIEFDCVEQRFRLLASRRKSERMGMGDLVESTDDVGKWTYITPKSIVTVAHLIVCE